PKVIKPQKTEDSFEVSKEHKSKPTPNLKQIVRKKDSKESQKPLKPKVDTQAQQLADARRRASEAIGRTTRSLRENLTSGITIEEYGPGGGGETYANYDQVVKSIYDHAWIPPDDTADDNAITKDSV